MHNLRKRRSGLLCSTGPTNTVQDIRGVLVERGGCLKVKKKWCQQVWQPPRSRQHSDLNWCQRCGNSGACQSNSISVIPAVVAFVCIFVWKPTSFCAASGLEHAQHIQDQFRFRRAPFNSQLKSKVDNILSKVRKQSYVSTLTSMTLL